MNLKIIKIMLIFLKDEGFKTQRNCVNWLKAPSSTAKNQTIRGQMERFNRKPSLGTVLSLPPTLQEKDYTALSLPPRVLQNPGALVASPQLELM